MSTREERRKGPAKMSIRTVSHFTKVESILGPIARGERPVKDDQAAPKEAWADYWAKLKALGERVMAKLSGGRK